LRDANLVNNDMAIAGRARRCACSTVHPRRILPLDPDGDPWRARWQAVREHRLARTRRPDHEEVGLVTPT
jgi:hypothetical protein